MKDNNIRRILINKKIAATLKRMGEKTVVFNSQNCSKSSLNAVDRFLELWQEDI